MQTDNQIVTPHDDNWILTPEDEEFYLPEAEDEYDVDILDRKYKFSYSYPLTQIQFDALKNTIASLNTHYNVKHEAKDRPVRFVVQQYHIPVLQKLFAGWKRQAIIKGRQVYMTTAITLLMIDFCVRRPFFSAMVNNMTEPDQIRTLEEKFSYVIHQSPWVAQHVEGKPLKLEVKFKNGSKIGVSRSGRSRTTNFNLITEASVTAERFPDAFRETVVGTINGGQYYITMMETSPYGFNNPFIQLVRDSIRLKAEGKLTKMDFDVEFTAWWRKWANRMRDRDVVDKVYSRDVDSENNWLGTRSFPPEMSSYFGKIEREMKMKMDVYQKVFYIVDLRTNCMGNPLIMRQEHPSTIEEALQTFSGAYILRESMDVAQNMGRIDQIPVSHSAPCAVFWDFGGGRAHTAFSIMQMDRFRYPNHYKWVYSFSERSSETLPVWFSRVNALRLNIKHHFLPHDAGHLNLTARKLTETSDITIYKAFKEAGIRNVSILPKIKEKKAGFEASNRFVYKCVFDKMGAQNFINSLYSATRKYDDKNDVILEELDNNNPAAHTYDTFELAALAYEGNYLDMLKYRPEEQESAPDPSDTFDGAPI